MEVLSLEGRTIAKVSMRMDLSFFYLFVMFTFFSVGNCYGHEKKLSHHKEKSDPQRSNFPDDFVFGTASSAYQYEGAASEDGRKPSIWDTFTGKHPEKIADRSSGAVAVDFYHRYKEDVSIMKNIGLNGFRFSISWSRVLPGGNLKSGVNQKGIEFYNNLINELQSHGIKPFVTLFHWDVPQAIEDEYGGFQSSKIVNDFRDYADLCFGKFGDRVKHWITLNEPASFVIGYADDIFSFSRGGDPSRQPYIVAHNQLLAHAASVQVHRQKYQKQQKGEIGITLNSGWILPLTKTDEDQAAADRALAFQYGLFMEPLKSGKYPEEVASHVKDRLPQFSEEESSSLKGSYDFIGLNYYTSEYASNTPCPIKNFSFSIDSCVNKTFLKNGKPIGPRAASPWLYVYPEGLRDILSYTKTKYNDPVIYITENGFSDYKNGSLQDSSRVQYLKDHISYLQEAIRQGVKLKGYFAWSLLDNFEWTDGFTIRFGIVYVDYNNGLKRSLKNSAEWFKNFLSQN